METLILQVSDNQWFLLIPVTLLLAADCMVLIYFPSLVQVFLNNFRQ